MPTVDNFFAPNPPRPGKAGSDMHFGRFLAAIRSARGMTQQSLADASGISTSSIQRGEGSEACPFRRSNATSLLAAIESVAPLSAADRETFLKLTGLEAFSRMAAQVEQHRVSELQAIKERVQKSPAAIDTSDDLPATTAHEWLQTLIENAGPAYVLPLVEAMAKAIQMPLTPPVHESMPHRPVWTKSYIPAKAARIAKPNPSNEAKLPVLPNSTKVVHPSGAIEYIPKAAHESEASAHRKRKTS